METSQKSTALDEALKYNRRPIFIPSVLLDSDSSIAKLATLDKATIYVGDVNGEDDADADERPYSHPGVKTRAAIEKLLSNQSIFKKVKEGELEIYAGGFLGKGAVAEAFRLWSPDIKCSVLRPTDDVLKFSWFDCTSPRACLFDLTSLKEELPFSVNNPASVETKWVGVGLCGLEGSDCGGLMEKMEYIRRANTLRKFLRQRKTDDSVEDRAKKTRFFQMRSLGTALEEVKNKHLRGKIHRDLKPENIFLGGNNEADTGKLGDNSFCTTPERIKKRKKKLMTGTPKYIPWMLKESDKPTFATDAYALGVIGLEIIDSDLMRAKFTEGTKLNGDKLKITENNALGYIGKKIREGAKEISEKKQKYAANISAETGSDYDAIIEFIELCYKLVSEDVEDRFCDESIPREERYNSNQVLVKPARMMDDILNRMKCGNQTMVVLKLNGHRLEDATKIVNLMDVAERAKTEAKVKELIASRKTEIEQENADIPFLIIRDGRPVTVSTDIREFVDNSLKALIIAVSPDLEDESESEEVLTLEEESMVMLSEQSGNRDGNGDEDVVLLTEVVKDGRPETTASTEGEPELLIEVVTAPAPAPAPASALPFHIEKQNELPVAVSPLAEREHQLKTPSSPSTSSHRWIWPLVGIGSAGMIVGAGIQMYDTYQSNAQQAQTGLADPTLSPTQSVSEETSGSTLPPPTEKPVKGGEAISFPQIITVEGKTLTDLKECLGSDRDNGFKKRKKCGPLQLGVGELSVQATLINTVDYGLGALYCIKSECQAVVMPEGAMTSTTPKVTFDTVVFPGTQPVNLILSGHDITYEAWTNALSKSTDSDPLTVTVSSNAQNKATDWHSICNELGQPEINGCLSFINYNLDDEAIDIISSDITTVTGREIKECKQSLKDAGAIQDNIRELFDPSKNYILYNDGNWAKNCKAYQEAVDRGGDLPNGIFHRNELTTNQQQILRQSAQRDLDSCIENVRRTFASTVALCGGGNKKTQAKALK